jgi:hypothetical protein
MVGIDYYYLVIDAGCAACCLECGTLPSSDIAGAAALRNYVLGSEPKARRLDCNSARSDKERCGWAGRYFARRRAPTIQQA